MSVKVYSSNPILSEFRQNFDEYDQWSCTLSAQFAVAECMSRQRESIPSEWEFRPGMGLDSLTDEEWVEDHGFGVAETVLIATEEEREFAGRVLAMYATVLRMAGKDY